MSDSKRLQEDIIALVKSGQREDKVLSSPSPTRPIGPSVGSAAPAPTQSTDDTSIASPLTEVSRTYHATKAVSSDGLFSWSVVHELNMLDANDVEVQLILAEPT